MRTIEASPHVEALRDAISAPRLEEFLSKFEGEDALHKAIDLYKWPRSNATKRNENPLAKKTRERLLSKIEDRIIRGEIWRPRRKTAAPEVERPC